VTRDLVHILVTKFGGYHSNVAQKLGTEGTKKYLEIHSNFLASLCTVPNVEELSKRISAGYEKNKKQ
jgi:hypothetical protein